MKELKMTLETDKTNAERKKMIKRMHDLWVKNRGLDKV